MALVKYLKTKYWWLSRSRSANESNVSRNWPKCLHGATLTLISNKIDLLSETNDYLMTTSKPGTVDDLVVNG